MVENTNEFALFISIYFEAKQVNANSERYVMHIMFGQSDLSDCLGVY